MPLSLYEITVPVLVRHLEVLARLLEQGRAFAEETGVAPETLLKARLIDDMLPLIGQVQRACDTAKFVPVRVAGVPNMPMADDEASFGDLQARIAATIAFLRSSAPGAFDGREEAEVVLPGQSGPRLFTGRSYVLDFALPNFFFHITTAYDLLRHKGVPIGKRDYLALS